MPEDPPLAVNERDAGLDRRGIHEAGVIDADPALLDSYDSALRSQYKDSGLLPTSTSSSGASPSDGFLLSFLKAVAGMALCSTLTLISLPVLWSLSRTQGWREYTDLRLNEVPEVGYKGTHR